jgi:hypothetical protein
LVATAGIVRESRLGRRKTKEPSNPATVERYDPGRLVEVFSRISEEARETFEKIYSLFTWPAGENGTPVGERRPA